jgi:hypothetical protein
VRCGGLRCGERDVKRIKFQDCLLLPVAFVSLPVPVFSRLRNRKRHKHVQRVTMNDCIKSCAYRT